MVERKGETGFWVDWSGPRYPEIRRIEKDCRCITPYTETCTLTECKEEIDLRFQGIIEYAQERRKYYRGIRKSDVLEQD